MKYCTNIIVILILALTAFAQEPDALRLEAERFARESEFLTKQGRFEAALEKAEAAAALEPENIERRTELILALLRQASETICPGKHNTIMPDSLYPKVSSEKMQASLDYARRAQELSELEPRVDIERAKRGLIGRLREKWQAVVRSQLSDFKEETEKINRRCLEHWMKTVYRPAVLAVTTAKDWESYHRFVRASSEASSRTWHQSERTVVELYEEIIDDILRITQIPVRIPKRKGSPDEWSRNMLLFFSEFAALTREPSWDFDKIPDTIPGGIAHRYTKRDGHDPEIDETLKRIYEKLENDSRLTFQLYGWLAKQKILPRNHPKEYVAKASRNYFDQLKRKISELPRETDFHDYSILYEAARDIVRSSYDPLSEEGGQAPSNGKRRPEAALYVEILELANFRNEIAPQVARDMIFSMDPIRIQSHAPEVRQYYQRELPRYETALVRQIELAERLLPDRGKTVREYALRYDIAGLRSEVKTPWKREINIVPKMSNLRYRHPMLRGDMLYFFSEPEYKTIRLDCLDLKTFELKSRAICLLENHYSVCSFVDDQNAYLGSRGGGLVVFPLDGTNPWTLTIEDGLPNGFVHGLGSIAGKLYVGLGEEGKPSWLVQVDLETRDWNILVSSSAKDGESPFFNLSPAPQFVCFQEDVRRNRLLFFAKAFPNAFPDWLGLWSIDGVTGEFKFEKYVQNLAVQGQLFSDRLLLHGIFNTHLVDLTNPDEKDSVKLLAALRKNRTKDGYEDPILNNCRLSSGTVYDGFYWGRIESGPDSFWGRIALDGRSKPERLTKPLAVAQDSWYPNTCCLPTPDGKGLLVGDQDHLILLRFE